MTGVNFFPTLSPFLVVQTKAKTDNPEKNISENWNIFKIFHFNCIRRLKSFNLAINLELLAIPQLTLVLHSFSLPWTELLCHNRLASIHKIFLINFSLVLDIATVLELLLWEFVMRICCFKLTEKFLLSLSWFICSLWYCWPWGPIILPSAPPGFFRLHAGLFHILFNGALSLQLYTTVLSSYWCLKLYCAIGFWWCNLPWQHCSIVKFSLLFVNFLYITYTPGVQRW